MTRGGIDPRWPAGQPPEWLARSGILWDNWSINGEVCITGFTPPVAGHARLAHCLGWLLRELASHCRRTHVRSGVLAFTCTGQRTPTALARTLSLSFDLLLQDAGLIREHARRRSRGAPAACPWPALWLEGATLDYLLPDMLPPLGGAPRRKLVVLAEERQVFVPARPGLLANGIRRKWAEGLAVLARVDEAALARLLDQDEQGFLANMLVLVHAQPAGKVRPRPSLEQSYRRHEALVAALAPLCEGTRLPVAWRALWRLPPGMNWGEPDQDRWMRYPALSFVVASRPLGSASRDDEQVATVGEKATTE